MKSTLNKVVIFAIGAAIGSLVAWKLTKTKYEKIVAEEEKSLREYYHEKTKAYDEAATTLHDYYEERIKEIDEKEKQEKEDGLDRDGDVVLNDLRERYLNVLKDHKYSADEPCYDGGFDRPYIVSPEEFGNADEYDIISLNYYADGVVADDWGDPIEDLEATIGEDFASHYGEYEEDVVYVRNDRLKVEYEILRSLSKFSDIVGEGGDDD